MKLKDGKSKVLTFSYDDAYVFDNELVAIFNKYGMKATFNLCSGRYFPDEKERESYDGIMKLSEAKKLYKNSGHEIAIHTFTHQPLDQLKPIEVLTEILKDRVAVERDYGVVAKGMAYPYGDYSDSVLEAAQAGGIAYARTIKSTERFDFPENWLEWHPTCRHRSSRLMEIAKRFVEIEPNRNSYMNCLFYVWGHSWEFNRMQNWNVIEEFCEYMGGREDIWYATNGEIYDYVKAYEALQIGVERNVVHNPTAIDVWFEENGQIYCVRSGKTLIL